MTQGDLPNARPDVPLPDRACIDPDSPFYRDDTDRLGVRFKGTVRNNVFEYCVSGQWVRMIALTASGRWKRDRHGKPLLHPKMQGLVEPYWRK